MNAENILEVRNLVKEFGDHRVIDGVSVGVTKGEVVSCWVPPVRVRAR